MSIFEYHFIDRLQKGGWAEFLIGFGGGIAEVIGV